MLGLLVYPLCSCMNSLAREMEYQLTCGRLLQSDVWHTSIRSGNPRFFCTGMNTFWCSCRTPNQQDTFHRTHRGRNVCSLCRCSQRRHIQRITRIPASHIYTLNISFVSVNVAPRDAKILFHTSPPDKSITRHFYIIPDCTSPPMVFMKFTRILAETTNNRCLEQTFVTRKKWRFIGLYRRIISPCGDLFNMVCKGGLFRGWQVAHS